MNRREFLKGLVGTGLAIGTGADPAVMRMGSRMQNAPIPKARIAQYYGFTLRQFNSLHPRLQQKMLAAWRTVQKRSGR